MDEGLQNLIRKAENGNVQAMGMIGDCYKRGFHAEQDDTKAHFYYKMAADHGHAEASYIVAIDFYKGIGAKKDEETALEYLRFAADHGVANAQYLLALVYADKKTKVFFRTRKIVKYYTLAAKQGHVKAQYKLAYMYFQDWTQGDDSHFEEAVFWLVCAALHKSESSQDIAIKARSFINDKLIRTGFPAQGIDMYVDQIQQNYPDYIIDSKNYF